LTEILREILSKILREIQTASLTEILGEILREMQTLTMRGCFDGPGKRWLKD